MMALPLQADPESLPLRTNADGVVLIGNTRVRLETVITAFHQGDSPEQIVESFDILSLADVYSVIAYYLNHREEVDAYIQQQRESNEQIHREIETNRPDMFSLRARLLEKKHSRS